MADNIQLNAGSGGDLARAEDLGGGVKMTVVKLHNGAAGADGGPITAANPLQVAIPGLPSGANLIGQASVAHQVNQVYSGTTALTPLYAVLSAAASGDANVLVAATAGKRILVLSYSGNVGGAVALKFRSFDGASTYVDLTGPMALLANQPIPGGSFCPVGLFATLAGQALTLNLGAAVQVSGRITYVLV